MEGVVRAWGKILLGYRPNLSIEITRECPLRCPGCYAYGDEHLGGTVTLRDVRDLKGQALIDGVLALIDRHRPLHLSIVGGEPLVRYRELNTLLPVLAKRGVYTQLVTSAVRPIPNEWIGLRRLQIVVSIDGLQPEHDARRKPATYDRILKHIEGHQVTVHCTVTRQQVHREGYLEEFVRFWSENRHTRAIWVSLYTPQVGECSPQMLTSEQRLSLVAQLPELKKRYPALLMTPGIAQALATPPVDPDHCVFSRVSVNYSADLTTRIDPCFFGGTPDCQQCGCAVTAGLHWIGDRKLLGLIRASHLMEASIAIGARGRRLRRGVEPTRPLPPSTKRSSS